MLFESYLGWPQVAAVAILAQRGLEELYSSHNTARIIAQGGREVGGSYYPVVAVTHLSWIAALFFLIPPETDVIWPILGLYLLLQLVRYWIIFSLGRFWTHRILTLEGVSLVRRGFYRVMRHPNYAVTIMETLLMPWAFGAWMLGLIMTAIWSSVIAYKVKLEDAALDGRREL